MKATEDQLNSARAIIELRMVNQNITDYELYVDYNQDHIIVRFPWKNDETSFDPESAIEELSATAMLTFREGNEYATQETDADGNPVYKTPTGTTADSVILEGSDVTSAEAQMYRTQQRHLAV